MTSPQVIPYVDLTAQHAGIKEELLAAVARVLDHGWFILGEEVAEFERRVAALVGVPHAVGVNSGTDALVLALRLHGVGPGDEVITTSHSFVATASAIAMVGAAPVFVDVDPDTMLMAPAGLADALTDRTRAVMPVHLGGFACDMDAIAGFCDAHGLALIEDCAQSIGATWRGRGVGSFGTGAFSLHPLKNLSACGDGGFLTVRDDAAAERLRRMRNIGLQTRDSCVEVSGNSRLDTLQAAMLLVKLDHLDAWTARRRSHAAAYRAAFAGRLRLSPAPPHAQAVYSTFVVRHPRRDALVAGLLERGVQAKVHYPLAIHQQPAFASPGARLPVTERVVNEIVSLPVTQTLNERQRDRVIAAVLDVLKELGDAPLG